MISMIQSATGQIPRPSLLRQASVACLPVLVQPDRQPQTTVQTAWTNGSGTENKKETDYLNMGMECENV